MKQSATSLAAGDKAKPQSASYAGAGRVDPFDDDPFIETGEGTRSDGSKEYILPKLPPDSVHVRKDVRVDFS